MAERFIILVPMLFSYLRLIGNYCSNMLMYLPDIQRGKSYPVTVSIFSNSYHIVQELILVTVGVTCILLTATV